jgi:hypothetical protein
MTGFIPIDHSQQVDRLHRLGQRSSQGQNGAIVDAIYCDGTDLDAKPPTKKALNLEKGEIAADAQQASSKHCAGDVAANTNTPRINES